MKLALHDKYEGNLEAAKEFQDFVAAGLSVRGIHIGLFSSQKYQLERGESIAGFEIKLDRKWKDTGNVCIETEERYNDQVPFRPSGPFHKDNAWILVIGDYSAVWIFSCTMLRHLSKQQRFKTWGTDTAKGFLIPVPDADKYAARKIEFAEQYAT